MAIIRPEMTLELMRKMQEAGCVGICWGLESGSAKTLSLMRKGITPSLMDQVIREAHAAGLKQYGNIIIGFPGEGPYEFAESMLFMVKNSRYLEYLGLPIYIPQRNSTVYKMPQHFGMADLDTYEWKTADQTNTPAIRVLRRVILAEIIAEKKLDQGLYNNLEAFHGVDLSDPVVAAELQAILRAYVEVTQAYLGQAPAELPILVDRWAADDKKGPAFPRGRLRQELSHSGRAADARSGAEAHSITVGGSRPRSAARHSTTSAGTYQEVRVGVPPPVAGWKEVLAGLLASDALALRLAIAPREESRQGILGELEGAFAQLLRYAKAASTASARIEQALPQAEEIAKGLAERCRAGEPSSAAKATVVDLAECLRSAFEWAAADSVAVRLRRAERQSISQEQEAWAGLPQGARVLACRHGAERAQAELESVLAPIQTAEPAIEGLDQGFHIAARAFVATTRLELCLQGLRGGLSGVDNVEVEPFRELLHGLAIAAGAYMVTEQVEQLPTLVGELRESVLPAWRELRGAAERVLVTEPSPLDAAVEAAPESHTLVDGAVALDATEELEAVLDDLWDGLKPQLRLATAEGIRPVSQGDRSGGARILDPHMLTTLALDALHSADICKVIDAKFSGGTVLLRSEAWMTSGAPEPAPPLERLVVVVLACGNEVDAKVELRGAEGDRLVRLGRGDALVLHEGTTLLHVHHAGHVLVGYFCPASQDLAPCYGRSDTLRHAAPRDGHEFSSAHYELMPDGEANARESAA